MRSRHTKLSFRNRRGREVDVPTVNATVAKNAFGRILDTAIAEGAVAISRHDAPRAVLLSIEEFDALIGAPDRELDGLTEEFDAMLASMQAKGAKRKLKDAFDASPAELRKAAMKSARKGG